MNQRISRRLCLVFLVWLPFALEANEDLLPPSGSGRIEEPPESTQRWKEAAWRENYEPRYYNSPEVLGAGGRELAAKGLFALIRKGSQWAGEQQQKIVRTETMLARLHDYADVAYDSTNRVRAEAVAGASKVAQYGAQYAVPISTTAAYLAEGEYSGAAIQGTSGCAKATLTVALGTWAGAKAGAAIGTPGGPVGMVGGALVGIGAAWLGGWAWDKTVGAGADALAQKSADMRAVASLLGPAPQAPGPVQAGLSTVDFASQDIKAQVEQTRSLFKQNLGVASGAPGISPDFLRLPATPRPEVKEAILHMERSAAKPKPSQLQEALAGVGQLAEENGDSGEEPEIVDLLQEEARIEVAEDVTGQLQNLAQQEELAARRAAILAERRRQEAAIADRQRRAVAAAQQQALRMAGAALGSIIAQSLAQPAARSCAPAPSGSCSHTGPCEHRNFVPINN
jgi:hypothetical protein